MSKRMYDFRCNNGHVTEHLVDPLLRFIVCPTCLILARRLIGTPRAVLDGCSGDFPTAADKWERDRESHMRQEQRNVREHGTYK
jgi:hypothetical protein